MAKLILVLLTFAVVNPLALAVSQDRRELAFISAGTFVVSKQPNVVIDSVTTRSKVGYLPVGTIVYLGKSTILREDASEKGALSDESCKIASCQEYYDVLSEYGVNGLVRKDRVTKIGDKQFAVAVTDAEVQLYSANNPMRVNPAFNFTRTAGTYVEILSDQDQEFYDVYTHWSDGKAKVRKSDLIDRTSGNGTYVLLSKATANRTYVEVKTLGRSAHDLAEDISGLPISYMTSKLDESLQEISDDLAKISHLRCLADVNLASEIGLKIFGNGLSIEAAVNLFEKDHMYDIDIDLMYIGGKHSNTLISVKKIHCKRVLTIVPEKMVAYGLFADKPKSVGNQFYAILNNAANIGEDTFSFVTDVQETPPMVEVNSWYDYDRYISHLRESKSKYRMLRNASAQEQEILLHFVLSKVAFFSPSETERH